MIMAIIDGQPVRKVVITNADPISPIMTLKA
jgi:hypothetical protein